VRSALGLLTTLALVASATVRVDVQTSTRTTWDGVYTSEQAARGAMLYAQHCSLCHAPALTGADAPPLTGIDFTSNWNGLSLGDLYERIRSGMPLNNPDEMNAQQKIDVLAHMLSVSKFPIGTTELPRDAQVLSQIRFLANKPSP
jgi:mono/diheme cytochrome c family protein